MTTSQDLVRIEPCAKRLRTYLGGQLIADTRSPLLVWEMPYHPTYYFPVEAVHTDLLVTDGQAQYSPTLGNGILFTVKGGGRTAPASAIRYLDSPIEQLRAYVRFNWDAMDSWFEEDEEIFVHPRDPHTRIDILPSSRRIRVEIGGVAIAESPSPWLLFETGLPVRYYLPKTHVRMDLLVQSDTVTACPYKGTAEYWSARISDVIHSDIAWGYRTPLPESRLVAGQICFYNEKVDTYIDDVLEARPTSYTTRLQRYLSEKKK